MIECKNIFYMHKISKIGGTESWNYYIARYLEGKDITIVYRIGDNKQINRYMKFAQVIKWDGKERFKCEKIFCSYYTDILPFVEAKEKIQVLHTDYKEQQKNIGFSFNRDMSIDRYIAPTKVVAEHFTEMYQIPCRVVANPIVLDKPRKVLHLISATRLTKEKGKQRMIKLMKKLEEAKIPYLWTVFTNDREEIKSDNVVYMKPRLDITDYIADADYLVQLSDNGEAFGYSVAEALTLGTPVIVTPVEAFLEIGVTNENGFVLDWDLKNVNVQDIYKKRFKFNYTPPITTWEKEIAPGESKYKYDGRKAVEITKRYYDMELEKWIEPDTTDCLILTKERAKYLIEKGVANE